MSRVHPGGEWGERVHLEHGRGVGCKGGTPAHLGGEWGVNLGGE